MKNNLYQSKKWSFFNFTVYLLVGLLFIGCHGCEQRHFQMPNGQRVKQTSIRNLEKEEKIHYEQYRGFVLRYQDSLFTDPLLSVTNNDYIVGADILSDGAINNLKQRTIESVQFEYILPNNSKHRLIEFEAFIKKVFKDYDKEVKTQNGFTLEKNRKPFLEVSFYSIAIPNYSVTIYPTK